MGRTGQTGDSPRMSEVELARALSSWGLWSARVQGAVELARRAHGEQVRDDGTPYLEEHVWPIAAEAAAYAQGGLSNGHAGEGSTAGEATEATEAETMVVVALLHDTLEDWPEATPALLEEQFGKEVAAAVVALTKPPRAEQAGQPGERERGKHEREEQYFAGLRAGPRVSRVVKVLDRLNNLACIHKSGAEKRRAYLAETRAFHLPLARELDGALATRLEAHLAALEAANG
ncbi:MAG: hypothetical protein AVDCRST_MAG77-4335 [uncultured Chloroflexi bacterium]|uniref:GTP diphosphokinase n=1 Tax=uncultured Chloroflexota bacterium TaxID=166587 RepID=A0A6J4JK03_9CHLR|nr:MAG: hypothetical protein AVDCRST_MAG77-4335 [uncultured Chloroflexota bacterium]